MRKINLVAYIGPAIGLVGGLVAVVLWAASVSAAAEEAHTKIAEVQERQERQEARYISGLERVEGELLRQRQIIDKIRDDTAAVLARLSISPGTP